MSTVDVFTDLGKSVEKLCVDQPYAVYGTEWKSSRSCSGLLKRKGQGKRGKKKKGKKLSLLDLFHAN